MVTDSGEISTLAVLPSVEVVLTARLAVRFGLPACAVGDTFRMEPVPTGVAGGHGGPVYVSASPAGTGEESMVWRIDVETREVTRLPVRRPVR